MRAAPHFRISSGTALIAFCAGCAASPSAGEAWIRVNQIGFRPEDHKIAVLMSEAPLAGHFEVGNFSADLGPDQGRFGAFEHHYRLEFTALRRPGRHVVRSGRWRSSEFVVGPDAWSGVPEKLLGFIRLQRCGANPVTGRTCHGEDGFDALTGRRVDLTGGWHDAGDRIKHVITTSWCVAALFLAGEEEEARLGAAFLRKVHPDPETIYVQVGDDRDHTGGWTFWHEDRVDYGQGPGGPRAAWRATGAPEGPKYRNTSTGLASLAGRCAAALALAGDIAAARTLYRLAKDRPGCAQSVPVRAPHHYGERTFHDDLEWAAVELYRATGEAPFLEEAVRFAHLSQDEGWMGRHRHGHYEFFPYVNLAHWRLHDVADEHTKRRLAEYYRSGLEEVQIRAEANPWRLGTPLVWCSTNDAIGFATQAVLYERMTGDTSYRGLATEVRDWIFGRNPWGVSFVTGVPEGGSCATRVHHPFARLGGPAPAGGLVDGPVSAEVFRSLPISGLGPDRFARFQSDWALYHDDVQDFATNEPILDGTVSLLLLLRLW
jgi:hypothetical protein